MNITMSSRLLDLSHIPSGASPVSIATIRLSKLLRTHLGDLLLQHGNIGLPSWRIYTGLAEMGEATQKQLVAHCRMEQSHISRALAQLETKEKLESRRCDEDKRARRFRLTPTGQKNYQCLLPIVEGFYSAVDDALTSDEIKHYLNLTERLAKAAETSAVLDRSTIIKPA